MTRPAILPGRTAMVTGGSSGIGFELARALCAEGARVVIAATDSDRLQAATAVLRREGGVVLPIVLDVGDAKAWPRALADIEASWGPVDILCLNAGISSAIERVEDTPLEVWRRIIETNLNGVFYAMSAWLPNARRRDAAHVLITGSLTGLTPMAGCGAYGASKAGLWMLADILRAELDGSNVGISVMHPGVTRTALNNTSHRHNPELNAIPIDPRVTDFMAKGADPAKVAAFTVAAMKRGAYHIGTHPEHKDGAARRFSELLEAMSVGADPDRDISIRPRINGAT